MRINELYKVIIIMKKRKNTAAKVMAGIALIAIILGIV
jgi:hypothetical protein